MATNFDSTGVVVSWTNATGSAVASGQPVQVGSLAGVALVAIANGATGSVAISQVYNLPKITGSIGQGVALFWDNDGDPLGGVSGSGALTTVEANGDYYVGASVETSALGTIACKINEGRVLAVTANQVQTGDITDLAVTTGKLAADAVTGPKIADDAIDSEHVADGAIDLAHMSANSVDSDQYVDGSIDLIHLSADCVDGTKIADDAVDSEHIADGAIDLAHMSANSVDSDQYVDGSIDNEHVANATLQSAKASIFVSAELTGNGAPQSTAHGLGRVPALVLPMMTGTAGACAIAEGAHDGTNVIVTATAGEKYRVIAW